MKLVCENCGELPIPVYVNYKGIPKIDWVVKQAEKRLKSKKCCGKVKIFLNNL